MFFTYEMIPTIIWTVIIAFNIAFLVRFMFSKPDFKTAIRALVRLYGVPIFLLVVIREVSDRKRQILFKAKNDKNLTEEEYEHLERMISSPIRFTFFVVVFMFKCFRTLTDIYIESSLEYEANKAKSSKKIRYWEDIHKKVDIQKSFLSKMILH